MKTIHKIIISVSVVLMFSLIIFFVYRNKNSRTDTENINKIQYISELPLISVNSLNKEMNFMYPNIYEISGDTVYDTLSILPEDRKLELSITDNKLNIENISYEIRSLDKTELIESKSVEIQDINTTGKFNLDIENVIVQNREYNLKITVKTAEQGELFYYSRIRSYDSIANEMLDTATLFSERNFDYKRAEENTVYLETDAGFDNSNLALVTLKSSFKQLTYSNLKLTPSNQKDIRLLNYDGNMGEVLIRFMAHRQSDTGRNETYEIEESFVLRRGEERIYMLSYTRSMREIFGNERLSLTGTRLVLGITAQDSISIKQSEDKKYQAYVSLRDLFVFDNEENKLYKIFSFKTNEDNIKNISNKHDVKILRIDNKKLDFIVYGYMSKGDYEGRSGALLLSYDLESKILEEKLFIDSKGGFGEIKQDINTLSYLSADDIFYIKNGRKAYAIDLKDKAKEILTELALPDEFFVSESGEKIAYIDGNTLKIKDISSNTEQEKIFQNDIKMKAVGFVREDFVLGKTGLEEEWIEHGKIIKEPFREIEIFDKNLQILSTYKNGDLYVSDIRIERDRIHFIRLEKKGENKYSIVGEDTIANSEENTLKTGIGYYASENKGRVYYIQTTKEFDVNKTGFDTAIGADNVSDVLKIDNAYIEESNKFFVYINGNLKERKDNFVDAINSSYTDMGIVRYKGNLVYARASNTGSSEIKKAEWENIDYIADRENGSLVDLGGLSLRQVLYFVGKKKPVLAYNSDNKPLIIYGYDRYNISVYEIETENTYKIGLGDATEMFEKAYNDFMIGEL